MTARRRRVLPAAMLNERDGAHQGMSIAARFQRLKDLPEHSLFFRIHARLVAGKSPWRTAQWVQATVPPDDPLGCESIRLKSLANKLSRYRALLPPALLLPDSFIDMLVHRAEIDIDVMQELAALIVYQKQRISQFAAQEREFPFTVEQQRREVLTLAELLKQMRDTQISLGVVPGALRPQFSFTQTNVNIGADVEDLSDPLSRFLAENPEAIPRVMEALDRVVLSLAAGDVVEGETLSPEPDCDTRDADGTTRRIAD